MNALVLIVVAFTTFFLGYRFYSALLARKIYLLDDALPTPAHVKQDGMDYVPTRRAILFGHHFTTIAGVSPIVGPAIAVFWGWLPAFLWVVLGGVFLGAVHDFGAMYVSLRHGGRTVGDLTREVIGPRCRVLFLWIIFFLLLIVLAVFALVIASLLISYPESVVPVVGITLVAMVMGTALRKTGLGLLPMTIVSVALMYLFIRLGVRVPFDLAGALGMSEPRQALNIWLVLILLYSFAAAILPVWLLLQPRDHINAWCLFAGLALILGGLFIVRPEVVAPAINHSAFADPASPPILPILFITIACGAISGFHSLVSSGTSVRQIDKESDARPIAYGSMITESILSVITIVVCCSAVTSEYWYAHYGAWGASSPLGVKLEPFVEGSALMMSSFGMSTALATTIVSVVIISFALTTIDSCMRLQRFVVAELFANVPGLGFARTRLGSGLVAVATALLLCINNSGMKLWPLFGTLNQLLAALALLVVVTYLKRMRRPLKYTLPPMIFVFFVTEYALLINLRGYWAAENRNILLGIIGLVLLVFSVWMILEAILVMGRIKKPPALALAASGGESGSPSGDIDSAERGH